MKRVTGIGGIFFRAQNADALRDWYREHLGIDANEWGGREFLWREMDDPETVGATVWSPFPADTDYFGGADTQYMINYRVADLDALVAALKAEGVWVDERREESEFGRFAWIRDPEGRRIELWEPPKSGGGEAPSDPQE